MAKLILGYPPDRDEAASAIKENLENLGHVVWMDVEFFAGDVWEEGFVSKLTDADAFVALASPGEETSLLASEAGLAAGYASSSGRLATIGAVIGEGEPPLFMQFFRIVRQEDQDLTALAKKINDAVSEWLGRRLAESQKTEEIVRRIEENSADYINEALQEQRAQARANRLAGTIWYAAGFLSLLGALAIVILGALGARDSTQSGAAVASNLIHGVIAAAILAACAKFGFALGKSFTSESIKNLDRMHAISFGKFYLKAFGKSATWQELREVFQNWNLDRNSSFHSLDPSQIDPNIASSMGQAIKAMVSKAGS